MKDFAVCISSDDTDKLTIYGIRSDRALCLKRWGGNGWLPPGLDWTTLGGAFDSTPAAAVQPMHFRGLGSNNVFGLGTGYDMYTGVVGMSSWPPTFAGWNGLNGVFNGDPIALWRDPNNLEVFGLGTDNQLYHRSSDGSQWLGGWEGIGGKFLYQPGVAAVSATRLELFGVGTDRQMYHKTWDGGQWQPGGGGWTAIGGLFICGPTVVSWGNNRVDVFALGMDSQMYHRGYDGQFWYPANYWEPIGGAFDSPPAAVSWGANRLDIFGLGSDDQMYHKAWDGNQWLPNPSYWEPLGGVFVCAPAVTSWGPNRLDIVGLSTDNAMYHKAWDGARWLPSPLGWEKLGGAFLMPRPTQQPPLPGFLKFSANIAFPDGVPVGGSAEVTVSNDGTGSFSGSFHDSGLPGYADSVVCVIKDAQNRAYTFAHTGSMSGTLGSGSRDDSWASSAPSNPEIAANWQDLCVGPVTTTFRASVNVSVGELLGQVLAIIGAVTSVIGVITA
jgi:hypothetical protein